MKESIIKYLGFSCNTEKKLKSWANKFWKAISSIKSIVPRILTKKTFVEAKNFHWWNWYGAWTCVERNKIDTWENIWKNKEWNYKPYITTSE